MIYKTKRGGSDKIWDELSFNQKRHRLFFASEISALRFWYVCGRDSQRYYQNIEQYTEDNINTIRDKMYDEYLTKLATAHVCNKNRKQKIIYNFLYGKTQKENN